MPRNGEKTEVNIRCCNGKSITFGFHTDFTGQQVFNLCKDKFEIESESHFGIQLPSGSWVAKNKALEKQLKKERLWLLSKEDSVLHFRIRFWPRRPHDVPDPQLKELLYRQIESDIKNERLFLDGSDQEANVLIKLGALQQQIEYGDTPGDISLNSNLTPIELTEKVIEQHRLLRGQSRSSAIRKFLESARQLTNYGIEIHTLSIRDRPYEIAVDCSGISINKRPKLKWASISEFRYRENKFTLVTKNANSEKVHTFTAPSTQKARALFLSMSENHQFHRPNLRPKRNRSGVSDLVNQTSQLISQIKDKSPFLQKKNHKSPSKNSRNGGISSDDPIRLSLPSNGDEKKERRKSAPPNVDKLMVVDSVDLGFKSRSDDKLDKKGRGVPRGQLYAISHPAECHLSCSESGPLADAVIEDSDEANVRVLERKDIGKGRFWFRLAPDVKGDFGISIIGGIDHGFAPYISKTDQNGLRSGDTIVAINNVPVSEHTNNQIKESIRASATCGELEIVIDRELTTFTESIEIIQKRRDDLVEDYERLSPKRSDLSRSVALKRENLSKNRYTDVLPYDDTRIRMEEPNGYINASWIDMHGGNFHRQWIAAQGPTQKTIGSFWRCVWETETSLILMLTRLFENANSKCDKYWPDEGFEQEYGSFYVANENELNHSFFIERKLKLTHIITGKEKPVTQLQYINWPDHGIPENPEHFLKFVNYFQQNLNPGDPCLVHCSAGVGRTGVTIAVDTSMALIEQKIPINPLKMVREMRDQRCMMVQTSSQFEFLLDLISLMAKTS